MYPLPRPLHHPPLLTALSVYLACALALTHHGGVQAGPNINATLDFLKWPSQSTAPDTMPPLLSVSVHLQQLPLIRLLQAISQQEGLSFDADECGAIPVTLSVRQMELTDLLGRLSDLARVRFRVHGKSISLRCDQPYSRLYRVDYPNTERSSQSASGLVAGSLTGSGSNGSISGNGTTTPTGSAQGGGNSALQSRHQNRYWEQLTQALENLLSADEDLQEPIRITETEQTRSDQGILAATPDRRQSTGNTANRSSPINGSMDSSLSRTTTTRTEQRHRQVVAHTESGLISIRATSRQHKQIEQFLALARLRSRHQVEVEATLLEVRLSESHQRGIQWNTRSEGLNWGLSPATSIAAMRSGLIINQADQGANGLDFAIRLLSQFGKVRVLSNPRVAILNQQSALLRMVDNRVYFTVSAQAVPAGPNSAAFSTFSTQAHTVPVGFVMSVNAQIDDARTVTLNLRPSLSRIVGFVNDPNPSLAEAGIQSKIPEIQTREIESVLSLSDGDIALLGGFIQSESRLAREGIPGLMDHPWTAWFSENKDRESQITELVILVRPRISSAGESR